jgi:hypothetical protein
MASKPRNDKLQMDLYMDNRSMSMFKIIDLTGDGQVYYLDSS